MLLAGRREGHPACRNSASKAPWDIVIVVTVLSGWCRPTAESIVRLQARGKYFLTGGQNHFKEAPLNPVEVRGNAESSQVGSGVEPQPKSNLVHFGGF